MICPSCNKMNKVDATFCPYCGHWFRQSVDTNLESQQISSDVLSRVQFYRQKTEASLSLKIKKNFFNYLDFVIQSLKAPTSFSRKIGSEHSMNGYITIVFTSIFYALGVSLLTKRINQMSPFDYSNSFSFVKTFFPSFFYILIWNLGAIMIIYILLTKWLKISVKFADIVGRYGGVSVILLFYLIIGCVLSSFFVGRIYSFYLNFLTIIQFFVIFVTVSSYRLDDRKKEPLYITLMTTAILIFINSLFLENLSKYMFVNIFS